MDGVAVHGEGADENLLTLADQPRRGLGGGLALTVCPRGQVVRRFRNEHEGHLGMLRAAELRALSPVHPGPVGLDGEGVDLAGDQVELPVKLRHPETVDDLCCIQTFLLQSPSVPPGLGGMRILPADQPMTLHTIEPTKETLHGHYSRDLPPVLTIAPGDRVRFRTLEAGWSAFDNPDPFERPPKFPDRDRERDPGHALCGPIAIDGARAGMTLEVRFVSIRTGTWGWSSGGGWPSEWNERLHLADPPEWVLRWALDPDSGLARDQHGQTVRMRPFIGNLGMPPDEPGRHSTVPPRFCGGNIDCKELVEGCRLYLPIPVDGGLFSLGDGHAVQGDGEVAGPALECPMAGVEVEFHLHPGLRLRYPRAETPAGWVTLGFHEGLDEAAMIALEGMLDWMAGRLGMDRKEALALSSLVVDLRVTQMVNGVRGAHAVLPGEALDGLRRG